MPAWKVGDVVLAIKAVGDSGITNGTEYTVTGFNPAGDCTSVVNDKGEEQAYFHSRFEKVHNPKSPTMSVIDYEQEPFILLFFDPGIFIISSPTQKESDAEALRLIKEKPSRKIYSGKMNTVISVDWTLVHRDIASQEIPPVEF